MFCKPWQCLAMFANNDGLEVVKLGCGQFILWWIRVVFKSFIDIQLAS